MRSKNIIQSVAKPFRRFLFVLYLVTVSIFVTAQENVLQQVIPLPDTTLSLDQALILIEDHIDYFFSYNPAELEVTKMVNCLNTNRILSEVLKNIIDDPEITCIIIGNQIVIYNSRIGEPVSEFALPEDSMMSRITGKIRDAASDDPIPFATLSIAGTRLGTISNLDGEFIFNFSDKYLNDSLVSASLGFKPEKISIKQVANRDTTILMEPDYIDIQEVMIRQTDPELLLRSAVRKLNDNYLLDPFVQTCFYRETVKKNNRFIIISEAILGIYRTGLDDPFRYEQVKILKGRSNVDLLRTDFITLTLKAGLQTSLSIDIIRNRPDFLKEESFHNYYYELKDITVDENHQTYVIGFTQKETTDPPHFIGELYIDMSSLAIRAAEFEMDQKTIELLTSEMVVSKPRHLEVRPLSAKFYIRYKEVDSRYHLAYIWFDNEFRIRSKDELFGTLFHTKSEMAVTETDISNINKFRLSETINIQNPFIDMLGGTDETFWEDYNFIKPDEPLEKALIKISKIPKE
jgi:hypothetical protein